MPSAPLPHERRALTERTRPGRLADVVGNSAAIAELLQWAEPWRAGTPPPSGRAVALVGPPGVGKTTSALALARELGWTVVEMNASDARNQRAIELVAGRASLTTTLGIDGEYRPYAKGARTLIVLDEADSLFGRVSDAPSAKSKPASFRDFARQHYSDIAALNVAYGLVAGRHPKPFEAWEDVPNSPGRPAWSKGPDAQRDLADWRAGEKHADVSDRGGLAAIVRLIRETRQPVVLTMNDTEDTFRNAPSLRRELPVIRFDPVPEAELKRLLRRIILDESWTVSAQLLETILQRSRGDVRAALNDLEAVALLPESAARTFWGVRVGPSTMFGLVGRIMREPRVYRGGEIRDAVDEPPDVVFPFMEENVPRFARDAVRRYRGFEMLGRADRLLNLARRHRIWGLWPFATEVMTGGVALESVGSAPGRDEPVGFPQFLGAMGRSKFTRGLRTSAAQKIGRASHLSRRKAIETMFPLVEAILVGVRGRAQRPEGLARARALAQELGLTAEELAVLTGYEAESGRVRQLLATSSSETADEGDEPSPRGRRPASKGRAPRVRGPRLDG
ncbi:MAG TPA: AAA family ATPase [Thermoplasmata archaeon]|nr:AAA family ATPase [Thermoplasmata archaeon]